MLNEATGEILQAGSEWNKDKYADYGNELNLGWFKIRIDRRAGTKLGVDVDPDPDERALRVVGFTSGGLIEKWNNEHQHEALRVGDRIQVVNDFRGDVHKLVEECKREGIIELTVEPNNDLFFQPTCSRLSTCIVPCTGLSKVS